MINTFMAKQRSGNSLHKIQARQGPAQGLPSLINTKRRATVFDWEEANAKERAWKARKRDEATTSSTIKIVRRKKRKIAQVLSEIEFAQKHGLPKLRFNQLIRALQKLYKLRAKHRLTKDKIISNPEIIATYLRELSGNEKINLTEANIVAFSNWALGRDPSELILLK